MNNPHRLYLTFKNEDFNLRVQPHSDDEDLLVIKANHPEAVDHLGVLAEVDLGIKDRFRGSHYFITTVDKVAFVQGVAAALLHLAVPTYEDEEIGDIPEKSVPYVGIQAQGDGADDIPDA